MLVEQCAVSDVVITTALIGGVFAPRLITAAMVDRMQPGAVIVDLAADGGGNCELSKPGETIDVKGVTIIAPVNLAATMPTHASLLFSRNLTNFLTTFTKDKAFVLDQADDIQQGSLVTHAGAIVSMRVRDAIQAKGKAS
jgi:NAD/NADP transhydrogenase alpha subunit